MRVFVVVLVSSILFTACGQAKANAQGSAAEPQIQFAEKAVVNALNFRQGEIASFLDAKPFFSATGWADFMKRLTGFMDAQGAPTFTSSFTPSGPAIVTRQNGESIAVTVPGDLKHESRNAQGFPSTTTYRAEADIRVSASPFKVELLVQRTCGGATTKPSCR